MPDLPTRLARKWVEDCDHAAEPESWSSGAKGACTTCVAAAIREALEEAEKVVGTIECSTCYQRQPAIAAALAALREGA